MDQFTLHKRSQHSAASADDSAAAVVFDLFLGVKDEAQARHFTLAGNPIEQQKIVAELGAGVSREKLTLAAQAPVMIQPGAAGSREQGQSVSGDNTTTRIEMIDTGEVEVVSDENDSKVFTLKGRKLAGRVSMFRNGDTNKFNMTVDGATGTGGGSTTDANSDQEKNAWIAEKIGHLIKDMGMDKDKAATEAASMWDQRQKNMATESGKKSVAHEGTADGGTGTPAATPATPAVAPAATPTVAPTVIVKIVEDESKDPEIIDVDDFITPEFDAVISDLIQKNEFDDLVISRLKAIQSRLADKKIVSRDVTAVLRLISGGSEAFLEVTDLSCACEGKHDKVLTDNDVKGLACGCEKCKKRDAKDLSTIVLWDEKKWKDGNKKVAISFLSANNNDRISFLSDNGNGIDIGGGSRNGYEVVKDTDGLFSIPRYEFLYEGDHGGEDWNSKHLDEIESNFKSLSSAKFLDVPVKIGHHKNQDLRGSAGELAHGWVNKVWSETDDKGKKHGYLAIKGMPPGLAYLMSMNALKNRSAEIFDDFKHAGKSIGKTLKAISLLGTSTPAVRGMQTEAAKGMDLVHSFEENGEKVFVVANHYRSARKMADTFTLTKDELQAQIDSAVKKGVDMVREVSSKEAADLKGKVTELSTQLANVNSQRSAERMASRKKDHAISFDAFVAGGHLLPVQKDEYLALAAIIEGVSDMAQGRDLSDMLNGFAGNKDTLEFSVQTMVADKPVTEKVRPIDLFNKLCKGLKQIDLSTQSTSGGGNKTIKPAVVTGLNEKSSSERIHELAEKYTSENNKLTYLDAVDKAIMDIARADKIDPSELVLNS